MNLPLICHQSKLEPVAYYRGQIINAGQYLSDVLHLSQNLPEGSHVLNLANNRYVFLVGLGASIIQGKISLLPSAVTTDVLERLRAIAPDFFIISDHAPTPAATQYIDPTHYMGTPQSEFDVPMVNADQIIAYVFTSGSTGAPVPHPKRWGSLVKNIEITCRKLNLPNTCSIVGTTPSQHMYGFESNILLALLKGSILYDQKPFFPENIAAALNETSAPIVLVTTPFHLEALLSAETKLPRIDRVICATAPLSIELAQHAETTLGCQLSEIYGSTETGQIAVRRTAISDEWQLVDGIDIKQLDDGFYASGGHLPSPTLLSDHLEMTQSGSFRLLGRSSDMVNIAGKRTSLSYLNNVIKRIPEIDDAVFFIPSHQAGTHTRLALVHTTESLDNQTIRNALLQYIDPVFLPRFLIKTSVIPRNETGKILQSALDALISTHRKS